MKPIGGKQILSIALIVPFATAVVVEFIAKVDGYNSSLTSSGRASRALSKFSVNGLFEKQEEIEKLKHEISVLKHSSDL